MTKIIVTNITCKEIVKAVCHNDAIRAEHNTLKLYTALWVALSEELAVLVIIAYGNIKLPVGVHSLFDIFYHPENALVAIVKGLSEIGFLALCVTRR